MGKPRGQESDASWGGERGLLSTPICLTSKLSLLLAAFADRPPVISLARCLYHSTKSLINYSRPVQDFILWYLLCVPSGIV